jgi:voltage-gated potassium channel Kch
MLALAPPRLVQQSGNLVFTLWIAAALVSITGIRRTFWLALILGFAPALTELLVPFSVSPLPLRLAKEALWIAFPVYVAVELLVKMFQAEDITHGEIAGAVALYLLMGVAFGDVFELVNDLLPGAVIFQDLPAGATPGFADFLYFSFVTLTTTGYGDVAPAHPIARAVAMFEALVGLMYLSILVARIVSIHTARTAAAPRGPTDPTP